MDYAYVGYTDDKQIIKGKISAINEQAAEEMLNSVGYRVVNLQPVTPFLPDMGKLFQQKISQDEMTTFSRQLALLLEAGIGIVRSLELLQSQTLNKSLNKVLIEIVATIRSGSSLSAALAMHPHVFSTIYYKMVAVGEQTGNLESVLRSLADYAERESTIIKKVKQALTYPAIVAGLAVVVVAIMVTVVLPPIVAMFTSLGGELPIATRALLAFVDFVTNHGLYLLVGIIALGIAAFSYSKSTAGSYNWDVLMIKLPLLGHINLIANLARCCRNMSLLFRAGLPLPEIMTLTAEASDNQVIAKALRDVEQDMIQGEGLAGPMRKRKVFLPLMVEMTKVGEETGNLDATLTTVAESYEIEADKRIQIMLTMIEPAMTIAMGLVVAFLAVSIFMPLYSSLSLIG